MEKKTISVEITVLSEDELSAAQLELRRAAMSMTRNSYAPYSKFNVGAAILLANGATVCGANQENAAFPSGTCAERSACFAAGANHPGVGLRKIAIAARTVPAANTDAEGFLLEPVSPCGACRQALLEFESRFGDIEVLLCGAVKTYRLPSVASLLPLCFAEF